MELIVDQRSQGHNLHRNNYSNCSLSQSICTHHDIAKQYDKIIPSLSSTFPAKNGKQCIRFCVQLEVF